MPSSGFGDLVETQRETVNALRVLAERVQAQPLPRLEPLLEATARSVGELTAATASNTQALAAVSRELGGLPSLVAGLLGGARGGGSVLGSALRSGLGLVPLGLRIAGLFGGRRDEDPSEPTRFVEPPSLALEVANTEGILASFPRAARNERGEVRTLGGETRPVVAEPHVTVNVNAIDSRSFLDHSGEIARALRDAMLHMHPVNDLISEL